MSRFVIKCKKGQGMALGQLLRQFSFNVSPSWRPIGYSIDKGGNILYSAPSILPDMITFMKYLTDLQFVVSEDGKSDIFYETFRVTKKLNSSQLNTGKIKCVSEDKQLLSILDDEEVTIMIVFRKSFGVHTREENADYITESGLVGSNIKAMQSNHSLVKTFTYKVVETGFDTEDLVIDFVAKNQDEKTVLKNCIDIVQSTLSEVQL